MSTYPQTCSNLYRPTAFSENVINKLQHGVGVPAGKVARSAEEAEAVAREIGIVQLMLDTVLTGMAYLSQEVTIWLSRLRSSPAAEAKVILTMD
jgi:hypothetical protein